MAKGDMTRYEIKMKRAAAILDGHGMIEKLVAPGAAGCTIATVVVYVRKINDKAFETLLDSDPLVAEYFTHPVAGHRPSPASNGATK